MQTTTHLSDIILDMVETFLDGAPALEEAGVETLAFGGRVTGEDETVRMMNVGIDGDLYLVVVKRVGGTRA